MMQRIENKETWVELKTSIRRTLHLLHVNLLHYKYSKKKKILFLALKVTTCHVKEKLYVHNYSKRSHILSA